MSTANAKSGDSKNGIMAFLVLDTFVRLALWSSTLAITTALFTQWGLWPTESLVGAGLKAAWDWSQVLSKWILLYNVVYVGLLVILRLPIPTPCEGRCTLRPGGPLDRQLIWSALIAALTKARHDAPFPAFLVYHVTSLPPMRWLVGPVLGPRTASCNITQPTIVDPHMVGIGRNVVIGIGATIAGHYQDQDGVIFKRTEIEDNVLIGANAVMSGVHIREGATIAAGAVVLPGSVVGPSEYWSGNPARRRRSGSDAAVDASTALPVD